MISRRHCLKLIATSTVAGAFLPVSSLRGGQWPHRPVRLIVPSSAGSGTDIPARLFAEALAVRWKQPVVVENRPGADGLIGTAAFVAARDEHTLLFSFAAPITLLPFIHASLSYDPARDLVPIAMATDTFVVLTAHASLEVESLQHFVRLARGQPGRLNWYAPASALPYLMAGFLKSRALDLVQVPYRDQGIGLQDHAQGRIHLMMHLLATAMPLVQAGHVKLLAVTNSARSPMIPDVPTAKESGFPELAYEGLLGLFGPRGMSSELRDRIAMDVRAVATDPAIAARIAAIGQLARGTTPDEFAERIEAQRAKIAAILQETGMRPVH